VGLSVELKRMFFWSFYVNITLRHTSTQEKFSKSSVSEVFLKWFGKDVKSESVSRFMEGLFLWP